MRRLLALAVAALAVTAGTASADTFQVVSDAPFALPSAQVPNAQLPDAQLPNPQLANSQVANTQLPGETAVASAFPLDISTPPSAPEQLSFDQLLPIWQSAGQQYGIPWSVLASINKIESNFGQNMGPSSAGAVGWMQFMPDTWARWGTDADGNGLADPWTAADAIYSAARYLAAAGGAADIAQGVFSYNHAQWYVDEVLQLAQVYAGGGAELAQNLQELQARLDAAKHTLLEENGALLVAEASAARLRRHEDALLARAQSANLLSNRLVAQKHAVVFDQRVQRANAKVLALNARLGAAQAELEAARQALQGASFTPGVGQLTGAPAYSNGYVFPVGGGPGIVHVGHTHHDYPAADIAAPEGSPAYALSAGVVQEAFGDPSGRCGIGFTIATTDGLSWTYCHLTYLEPTVVQGAALSAGQPVGLVGQTGHAEGPHLHLQLQPANAYPQDEAWFQSFAGTAFTWTDSVQSNPAPNPVFAVVDEGAPPAPDGAASAVVFFTSAGG